LPHISKNVPWRVVLPTSSMSGVRTHFWMLVARESVVKAASWTHGLRRALSAESRNRIRFEVRRETRRAGRDRRAEAKQALREFRARERAAHVADAVGEDVA